MREFFSREKLRKILKYALYMFLTLVLQEMVLSHVRIFGVCPMVLPAAVVAVGMFEGVMWGSMFGLIMGIFADMIFIESTVTFTLLLPALAFAVGFVSQFYINRKFFAYMLASLAALFVTAFVQMLKVLAADGWAFSMITVVILQTLWSLPVSALLYFPPAKWIE